MSAEADCRRLLDIARRLIEDGVEDSQPLARTICATTIQAPRLAPRRLAALAPLAELFHWVQNPNYSDANMGPGYMDNYAYAELVGRRGLFGGGDYALGVLLLGPGLTYPPHAHPANEVYYVVGGTAEWRRGPGPWKAQPPGSLIEHPSGLVHATRTGVDPLLALYLWWGDIATHAKLTPGPDKS